MKLVLRVLGVVAVAAVLLSISVVAAPQTDEADVGRVLQWVTQKETISYLGSNGLYKDVGETVETCYCCTLNKGTRIRLSRLGQQYVEQINTRFSPQNFGGYYFDDEHILNVLLTDMADVSFFEGMYVRVRLVKYTQSDLQEYAEQVLQQLRVHDQLLTVYMGDLGLRQQEVVLYVNTPEAVTVGKEFLQQQGWQDWPVCFKYVSNEGNWGSMAVK